MSKIIEFVRNAIRCRLGICLALIHWIAFAYLVIGYRMWLPLHHYFEHNLYKLLLILDMPTISLYLMQGYSLYWIMGNPEYTEPHISIKIIGVIGIIISAVILTTFQWILIGNLIRKLISFLPDNKIKLK